MECAWCLRVSAIKCSYDDFFVEAYPHFLELRFALHRFDGLGKRVSVLFKAGASV